MMGACFSFGDLSGDDASAAPDSASDTTTTNDAAPGVDAGEDAYVYIPPADGSCPFEAPFGEPERLGNNSSNDDWSPRLMPDELTVFFASSRPGHGDGGAGLFGAARDASTDDFISSALLANVNINAVNAHPTVTGDGLNLYFQSNATGKNDIYYATRANAGTTFGLPSVLGISDPMLEDDAPYVLPSGSALYFVRYDNMTSHRIMRAAAGATASSFNVPASEDELNSTNFDTSFPAVTPDDLTIFFAANASVGSTDYDIYKAERASPTDPFVNITPVKELNTGKGDYPSWISSDGCTLFFMSVGYHDAGDLDMFVVKRSK